MAELHPRERKNRGSSVELHVPGETFRHLASRRLTLVPADPPTFPTKKRVTRAFASNKNNICIRQKILWVSFRISPFFLFSTFHPSTSSLRSSNFQIFLRSNFEHTADKFFTCLSASRAITAKNSRPRIRRYSIETRISG